MIVPNLAYFLQENLWWWLTEGEGSRDQYVVRYADQTEVFWNDGKKKPESNYKKKVRQYIPFTLTYLGGLWFIWYILTRLRSMCRTWPKHTWPGRLLAHTLVLSTGKESFCGAQISGRR